MSKENKPIFSTRNSLIILLIGITVVNAIVFSMLTSEETDQPKPLPMNMLTPIPNQYETLDKMNCNDIMTMTDNLLSNGTWKFTGDSNQDSYKAHAFDLRNQCLGSVSKYELVELSDGRKEYLLNGTVVKSAEMTHN